MRAVELVLLISTRIYARCLGLEHLSSLLACSVECKISAEKHGRASQLRTPQSSSIGYRGS